MFLPQHPANHQSFLKFLNLINTKNYEWIHVRLQSKVLAILDHKHVSQLLWSEHQVFLTFIIIHYFAIMCLFDQKRKKRKFCGLLAVRKCCFLTPTWKLPKKPGNPFLGLNRDGFKHKPWILSDCCLARRFAGSNNVLVRLFSSF